MGLRDEIADWGVFLAGLALVGAMGVASGSCEAQADDAPPQTPLVDRAFAWAASRPDGRWRMRESGAALEVRVVVEAADLVEREPWPDAEVLLAIAWRESRWRTRARGALGELGLAQVMPRYVPSGARDDLHDPQVNLFYAAGFLERHYRACAGDVGRALRQYATGAACPAPTWSERVVLNWAAAIRRAPEAAAQEGGSWSAAEGAN